MALRTFRGGDGVTWQVWSVVPGQRHDNERRRGVDRRSPDPVLAYAGEERRSDDRRRPLTRLGLGMECGWLTFESATQKRRLTPIPSGWDLVDDDDLAQLCSRAKPVGIKLP